MTDDKTTKPKSDKPKLDVSFDGLNDEKSQQAIIDGAGTGQVEVGSTAPDEIVVNGQTYQLASKQPEQPRSKRLDGSKKIWVADDVDPTKEKRKRNKHGTAINFPLYVEEFIAIEAVYEDALKSGDTDSFADYVREVLKTHAKSKLGKERYDAILAEKINQVMDK